MGTPDVSPENFNQASARHALPPLSAEVATPAGEGVTFRQSAVGSRQSAVGSRILGIRYPLSTRIFTTADCLLPPDRQGPGLCAGDAGAGEDGDQGPRTARRGRSGATPGGRSAFWRWTSLRDYAQGSQRSSAIRLALFASTTWKSAFPSPSTSPDSTPRPSTIW